MRRIFATLVLWVALAAPTYAATQTFNITARQSSYSPSSITVTKGDSVTLNLTSSDVTHGFSLPAFGVSTTITPGKTSTVNFTADTVGSFTFSCTVFCGPDHANMKGTVVVKEAAATNTNTSTTNINNANSNTNSANTNSSTNANSNSNANSNGNSNTNATNENSNANTNTATDSDGTVTIATISDGSHTYTAGTTTTPPTVGVNAQLHLTGTATPNAALVIEFCCSVTRFAAVANAAGSWSFQGTPALDAGDQSVHVYERDNTSHTDTLNFTVGNVASANGDTNTNDGNNGGAFGNIIVWVIIAGIVLMVAAGAFFARSMRR